MAEILRTYRWTLTLLTPLHIGSGDSLWEAFDFVTVGDETVVLEKEKIWQAALFDEQNTLNRTLLHQPPGALVSSEELGSESPLVRYRMQGTPHGAEVRAQLKDVHGRPYLPGSTLKGALRTVMLWEKIRTEQVKVRPDNLGRNRKWAAQPLEKAAFGRDPQHDLLRAIRVADSPSVSQEALRLVRAYAFGTGRGAGATQIPINVEAVIDGTAFTTEVTVDRYALQQLMGDPDIDLAGKLPAIARRWAEMQLAHEAEVYRRRRWQVPVQVNRILQQTLETRENAFLLQLGWGTGWTTKTISPLLPKPVQDQIVGRYGLSRGKHRPGDEFPKSRRMSGEPGPQGPRPALPFGWVLVEMET
jgi:CRISPR-associated protein Csm5